MQKVLVGLWVKNFTFINFKFTKAKFLHNFLLTQFNCVAPIVFRADTDHRKIVNFTYTQQTRKLEFEKWAKIPHHGQNLILWIY